MLFRSQEDIEEASSPVSPLPANRVNLPSFPRPSLSPSSSKTFIRTVSSRTSSGLDLSMSSNRYQPRFASGISPDNPEFSGSEGASKDRPAQPQQEGEEEEALEEVSYPARLGQWA